MTERIYYNKLVWDNVPDIIRAKGHDCEVRELTDEEYRIELLKKVEEEASALPETTSKQELIDEIADVITVIEYIKKLEDISDLDIADALERHARLRGRFERKQFLVWSSDSEYETNEKSKTVVRLTIPDTVPHDETGKGSGV
ncbi:MAG: nucleoside triphosphate pyrophosphohydrolase [Candidatus Pacebacteria bacterium]|nr:nucleoside triphosphate pyrophosphohydrolase [Candidatus Paceibacterota bacterium]